MGDCSKTMTYYNPHSMLNRTIVQLNKQVKHKQCPVCIRHTLLKLLDIVDGYQDMVKDYVLFEDEPTNMCSLHCEEYHNGLTFKHENVSNVSISGTS